MKSFQHLVLATVAALSVCQGATAQQVYRCGNSYSQSPCAGAVAVQTDDSRTAEQRAADKQALASDKTLARKMEASRRKDEAMALAADKLALAKAAAAHKKTEKTPIVKKEPRDKQRKATVKQAAPIAAAAGTGKKKAGSKTAKP